MLHAAFPCLPHILLLQYKAPCFPLKKARSFSGTVQTSRLCCLAAFFPFLCSDQKSKPRHNQCSAPESAPSDAVHFSFPEASEPYSPTKNADKSARGQPAEALHFPLHAKDPRSYASLDILHLHCPPPSAASAWPFGALFGQTPQPKPQPN